MHCCPSVSHLSVTFSTVAKWHIVGVGDGSVGCGVGKFLISVSSSHLAVCSCLATVCNLKFQSASVFVETVSYLFTDKDLTRSSLVLKVHKQTLCSISILNK